MVSPAIHPDLRGDTRKSGVIPPRIPPVHLARGAPSVRSWSRYQETDPRWSLCGVYRQIRIPGERIVIDFVEDPLRVLCPFCLDLMQPRRRTVEARNPGNVKWRL